MVQVWRLAKDCEKMPYDQVRTPDPGQAHFSKLLVPGNVAVRHFTPVSFQSHLPGIAFNTSPSWRIHLHLCEVSPGSVYPGSFHVCSPTMTDAVYRLLLGASCVNTLFICSLISLWLHHLLTFPCLYYAIFLARVHAV